MPRSSRHKSHKQHKHKDVREQSDSDEDVNLKDRNGKEEGSVRVSRDSVSSEKRKLVSLTTDSKHLSGSLDLLVDYGSSKRRKERVDGPVSDRWNGGDKEMKGEGGIVVDLEKGGKSKVSVDSKSDSKSKSSRRHESLSERKVESVGLVMESEEIKKSSSSSSKIDSKWKSEKDIGRKEVHQYKDVKEKEYGLERDKKGQDVKRESSSKIDTVAGPVKREVENAEGQMRDGQRNPELEKELDKRIRRRRDDSVDKDKYQDDIRDAKDSRLSTRDDRTKNGRYKDEKYKDEKYKDEKYKDERYKDERYKDDKYKDKYHEDFHKDHRNRDDKHQDDLHKDHRSRDDKHIEDLHKDHRSREDKHQEDLHKDHRNRDDKRRDDYSRDHTGHRSDTKHLRDDSKTVEIHHKKSKPQDRDRDRDGSPRLDDQASSYRDSRGRKRASDDNEDHSGFKSRSAKEQRYVDEKKSMSSSKIEPLSERGRSESRPTDLDSSISRTRRKSSPSTSARYVKDQYRSNSKQAEPKYKDSLSDERVRTNATPSRERAGVSGGPERVSESRSMEKLSSTKKPIPEDEQNLVEFSAERSPISEARASPLQLNEKSHSSTSIDRRYSNRTPVRRSIDVEETGRRTSGSKDVKDYSGNEDRGSRERPLEKPAADEFPQVDGDTVSVSSSFNRTSHFPSSSSSFPPPAHPSRMVGSPSVLGPSEEDSRGKSNNRYRRNGDFNVGRGQGNAWKGVPNWPSPLANGFIPFQHGPPPGGFHAMMQQFPAPPLFGIRSSMELNHNGVPYHITDADRFSAHGRPFGWQNSVDEGCPPHMHGWDGSTGAFGDESHMYGRPDWEQNRHMMNGRSWEASAEMWKGQNNSVNLELTTAPEKDDHLARASADEVWAGGQPGQRSRNERSRPGFRPESIEIKRSNDSPPVKISKEAPIKRTLEKTPEPSTKLNTDASFCHVYLSKLDISVDLTRPELYNQCMALFDIEGNSTGDAMKPVHPEDPREARLRISDTTLSASFFPAIKDTLLQRAMSLYKKQGELMKGNHLASSIPGSEPESATTNNYGIADQIPTPNAIADEPEPLSIADGYNLEPISTSAPVIAEEPVQTYNHEKVEETVLTSNHEKGEEPVLTAEEPVTASDLGKHEAYIIAEEPVSIPDEEKVERVLTVEEPVPNSDEKKAMEPILIPDEEKAEELIPTPDEEKVEEPVPILDEVLPGEPPVPIPDEVLPGEPPVPIPDEVLPGEPPVPIPDEVKLGEPIPIPDEVKEEGPVLIPDEEKAQEAVPILVQEMGEKSTTNFCQEVEDLVLNSETEKPEELVPASYHQDMEVVMANDLEKSEETIKDQSPHQDSSQVITIAPTNKDDVMVISSDSEDNENEPASICEEQKMANTSDHTICGPPLGFTNSSSEVCEALMPESIEYSSSLVNLSRIHHSPESTH